MCTKFYYFCDKINLIEIQRCYISSYLQQIRVEISISSAVTIRKMKLSANQDRFIIANVS